MSKLSTVLLLSILITSCSHNYYVVRHAEKATATANMSSDVELSEAGKARAIALSDKLRNKKVASIYSTNTKRTRNTAEPLRALLGIETQTYGPFPDSNFIKKLKNLDRNTLIVGHSNTVDDIVNGLSGQRSIPGDLDESEYDNLFVIRSSRSGKRIKVSKLKY